MMLLQAQPICSVDTAQYVRTFKLPRKAKTEQKKGISHVPLPCNAHDA